MHTLLHKPSSVTAPTRHHVAGGFYYFFILKYSFRFFKGIPRMYLGNIADEQYYVLDKDRYMK
ncbi:hypothetical protein PRIPAC_81041, partial [Pristionchus pacificus]|uniref:Uncharacterized protein n=1 Tax=Pristionchus pacificus TaxID=54126 RepID=A0A2A6CK86_PRIPA